jgi:Dyp-type peroxidase family
MARRGAKHRERGDDNMSTYEVRTSIDLHNTQGNIVKGYGRYGFPFARYGLFCVHVEVAGRDFIRRLAPVVTTGAPWTRFGVSQDGTSKPEVTTNVAFTFEGLKQLGLSERSLLSFPEEFATGMRARVPLLGDDGLSSPENWDPVWHVDESKQSVHILIHIQAATIVGRQTRWDWIITQLEAVNRQPIDHLGTPARPALGVELMVGHGIVGEPYQDAQPATDASGNFTTKEHFGFADGISDPFFADSGAFPSYVAGGGTRRRGTDATSVAGWKPLATGEFLLGHFDEAHEYPAAPTPNELSYNGTFLVYRKLHQNLKMFDEFTSAEGNKYGDVELFKAKLVGRWPNGAPLELFPTAADSERFERTLQELNAARNRHGLSPDALREANSKYYAYKQQLMAFDYDADVDGQRCPFTAHVRRANPRSSLEFGMKQAFKTGDALVNRRRMLRRGMPYGSSTVRDDTGDHGLIFIALCASINRQFEFVQQQWINFGNDFKVSSDRDPVIGQQPTEGGRTVIATDPINQKRTRVVSGVPRFVETRGGDYFFVPSPSALALIAAGKVDPT